MIQQAIEMPTPSGADTETVITALETAAVFRARGDRQEAVRWLRRAAESAGEAGDDHRALSLSRAAADLHEELEGSVAQQAQEQAPPVLPAPPSSRAARSPSASPRTSHPPPPSARGARPSSSPRTSYPPRPSSRPSYLSGARPPTSTQPPQPSAAPKIEATPEIEVHAQPKADTPQPPPLPVESVRPTLAPVTSVPDSEPAPTPSSRASVTGPARTGARIAARVAVTISTTKAGVLEVRLLAEGESPRIGSSEAMLVMLDPSTTLLSR